MNNGVLIVLKSMIRNGGRRLGVQIGKFHPERQMAARVIAATEMLGAPTVIDVGANTGQFGHELLSAGFRGAVISFEPLGVEHGRLSQRAHRFPNWKVAARCAIGDEDGETTIHRAGNSYSSSLLAMRAEHIRAAPGSQTIAEEKVRVRRLDGCAEITQDTSGPLFLKIDTQGFELHVLRGAAGLMPRIAGMIIECSLSPLYDGGPLFADVFNAVSELGFTLHDLIPGFQSPEGQMLQVDILVAQNIKR